MGKLGFKVEMHHFDGFRMLPTVSICLEGQIYPWTTDSTKITAFNTFSRNPSARRLLEMMHSDFEAQLTLKNQKSQDLAKPNSIQSYILYIHIYIYICLYIYVYIYIYTSCGWEKIVHQLVDGLLHYIIIYNDNLSFLPIFTDWCKISSIHIIR